MTDPAGEPGPDVLNVNQAAVFLQVGPDVVQKALKRGTLPGQKVGREWRLSRQALIAWLSERPTRDRSPDD